METCFTPPILKHCIKFASFLRYTWYFLGLFVTLKGFKHLLYYLTSFVFLLTYQLITIHTSTREETLFCDLLNISCCYMFKDLLIFRRSLPCAQTRYHIFMVVFWTSNYMYQCKNKLHLVRLRVRSSLVILGVRFTYCRDSIQTQN